MWSLLPIFRFWDLRQPNPAHTQLLPERCYALTVRYPLMVVGTEDRNLIVFNLKNPQVTFYFQKVWTRINYKDKGGLFFIKFIYSQIPINNWILINFCGTLRKSSSFIELFKMKRHSDIWYLLAYLHAITDRLSSRESFHP